MQNITRSFEIDFDKAIIIYTEKNKPINLWTDISTDFSDFVF